MHLLILVVLCAAAILTADYFVDRVEVTRLIRNFYDETGGITLTENSIRFNKHPEIPCSYLMSAMRVDNCPQIKAEELEKKFLSWKQPSGILIMPRGMIFWMRDFTSEEPAYRALGLPVSVLYENLAHHVFPIDWLKKTSEKNQVSVSANEIVREAALFTEQPAAGDGAATQEEKGIPYSLQEDFAVQCAMTTLTMFNGVHLLLEIIMLLVIALVFFTLALTFRASLLPRKMKFSRVLTLTIYSTFPPFVIASLFAMCQLQIISFQLVFFLSYFVYQFLAFNAVFRHFSPEPPQNRNGDDNM